MHFFCNLEWLLNLSKLTCVELVKVDKIGNTAECIVFVSSPGLSANKFFVIFCAFLQLLMSDLVSKCVLRVELNDPHVPEGKQTIHVLSILKTFRFIKHWLLD